ncbi:MAG: hypothetical protein ACI91B_003017, partial [Planctomycetota bacterium]
MSKSHVTLAIANLATVAAALCLVLQEPAGLPIGMEPSQASRRAPASDAASAVGDHHERKRVHAQIRQVVLVDKLTKCPLAGVQLIADAFTAVSDERGRLCVQTNGLASGARVRLVTSAEHGGKSFQRTLTATGGEEEVVTLPIWSGIRVEFQPLLEQAEGVISCRPVRELDQLGLPASTVRQLQLAKDQPGIIERHLDELGVERDHRRVSQNFKLSQTNESHTIVYSMADGAVFLSVFGRGKTALPSDGSQLEELVPQHRRLTLRSGQVTTVQVALTPKPVVTGRLVDSNGNAIADTVVVAAALSTFDPTKCVSHDSAEPGCSAIALVRQIGSRSTTGLIHRRVRTDRFGRFRVPISFS